MGFFSKLFKKKESSVVLDSTAPEAHSSSLSVASFILFLARMKWFFVFIFGVLFSALCMDFIDKKFFSETSSKKRKARVTQVKREGPAKHVLKPLQSYDSIVATNAFCPGCEIPNLEERKVVKERNCEKGSTLAGVFLSGTIVLNNPNYSVATIESGGKTKTLRVGDKLEGKGELFEIRRARICFADADDNVKFVEMKLSGPAPRPKRSSSAPVSRAAATPQVEGVAQLGENEFEIDRTTFNTGLNNPALLQEAQASPLPGGGFQIDFIQRGSMLEALGVKTGDKILEVNGEKLTVASLQRFLSEKDSLGEVSMTIDRGGDVATKSYKLK